MAEKETTQKEPAFTKEQLLASKQFAPPERDFLRAVLEEGKTYTIDQARKVLGKTLSKEVK
ncbi:hypothetical protein ABE237_00825 [Brevibacillus formosus]|uniref:hypothetical protein n=1 Tax=Brevibacillus formosus TaxID=54913 RepID=UPI0018CD8E82|nr:hypothetical protein [Brevibacillus formosus]MBG9944691.1 periplasmic component [Brevibacillus formosus]